MNLRLVAYRIAFWVAREIVLPTRGEGTRGIGEGTAAVRCPDQNGPALSRLARSWLGPTPVQRARRR
jgi:hypothetical protein